MLSIFSTFRTFSLCSGEKSSVAATSAIVNTPPSQKINEDDSTEHTQPISSTSYNSDNISINNNQTEQYKLIEYLLRNGTHVDESVVHELKTCAVCLSPDDQAKLIDEHAYLIEEIARNGHPFILRFFIDELDRFSDANLQSLMTSTIDHKEFAVFQVVLTKTEVFTARTLQRMLAKAISQGKFDENPDVLNAIIEKLDIFTDRIALNELAKAISKGQFGRDETVIEALINKLDIFTEKEDRDYIYRAISSGALGNNKKLLNEAVAKLEALAQSEAQSYFAQSYLDRTTMFD